jgi:hypothetical protein
LGYLTISDPDPWRSRGQVSLIEHDTFTCAHCSVLVKLVLNKDVQPHRARFEVNAKQVAACRRCSQFICDPCRNFSCDPIEEKLGRYEKMMARK